MAGALHVLEWMLAAVGAALTIFLGIAFVYTLIKTDVLRQGLREIADFLGIPRRSR